MDDAKAVLLEEPSQDANNPGQDREERPPDEEVEPTMASADDTSSCRRVAGNPSGERTTRQGDGGNGHCTEPEGGECHCGTRRRTNGMGTGGTPGARVAFDLEDVLRHRKGNTNLRGLESVAHDGSVLESESRLQVQVQRLHGNHTRRFLTTTKKLHRKRTLPAVSMPE